MNSLGAANDDKACVKEDERRKDYGGTEVERVNGETLLLQAHFCTDPCHIIRSCLSQTQSSKAQFDVISSIWAKGVYVYVWVCVSQV